MIYILTFGLIEPYDKYMIAIKNMLKQTKINYLF